MELSSIYLKTYKNCSIEFNNESSKLLYRSGLVKYVDSGSYCYTGLGNMFLDSITKYILDTFKENTLIKANGDKEEILKSYMNELKSYKNVPLNLAYLTLNKNKKSRLKDGLLNPKKENMIKIISIAGENDIHTIINNQIMSIDKLTEELNIKYTKLNNGENKYKYFFNTTYPLREVFLCGKCGYGDLKEEIKSYSDKDLSTQELKEMELIHTPNIKTIDDLESSLNISSKKLIKTILLNIKGSIVAVLLRGDRSINNILVAKHFNIKEKDIKMASEEEVKAATGAEVGFAGPIGIKVDTILCDEEVIHIKNGIVGANKTDYHIQNVNYKRDFNIECIGNFKSATIQDKCFNCGGEINAFSGINFIDIDTIKTEFKYLNSNSKEENLYIIETKLYTDRLFSIIVENNKDELGIVWPDNISPFDYHIIIGNIKKEKEYNAGLSIYENFTNKGYNVLLDDRKERIGFKFKDCELIGVPKTIVVGKDIENNRVEIRNRVTKESENIDITQLI
ncbi:YbaK/EbsC family protein [Tepidibacter hydrothermalis]|uniref:YbaK/EbsC family protein n=1 Tax=Tepidibacter hydrothermalis TaxID=3036126 RepID=A0ABY8EHV8_9FIRM|nr:YbaK/EbsC family protein [Tepidibacter hydrothermalis]WFD10363.1 YbaK/EbsC family protein [Tepidibacter hydrothermalis]